MMSAVQDYQFEFEGVRFGLRLPVAITADGFDPGEVALEAAEARHRYARARSFGTDVWTPPDWSWELHTNDSVDAAESLADMGALASVWLKAAYASKAGAVWPLFYQIGGRRRVVFGRPGAFTDDLNNLHRGLTSAQPVFRLAELRYYDADERSTLVGLVPSEPIGFTFPMVFPMTTLAGASRVGTLSANEVGGDTETPFRATITAGQDGLVNPVLRGAGWKLGLNAELSPGDTVTISTYPWDASVRVNGAINNGLLTIDSRLSRALLDPEGEALFFDGVDSSGTSTCIVQWRPAHTTI